MKNAFSRSLWRPPIDAEPLAGAVGCASRTAQTTLGDPATVIGSSMSRPGRDLEVLVALLESALVSDDAASIRSPDHLVDRVTGKLREVDVSVRYQVGSVPVLIILECRDRQHVEDVTWIEQLAQKRNDVRAARAVAVSSAGFSEAAVLKAAHLAIELRNLEDLTPDDIRSWFKGTVEIETIGFNSFVVHLANATIDGDLKDALAHLFDGFSLDSLVLTRAEDDVPISPRHAWYAYGAENSLFADVPRDGTRVLRTVAIRSEEPGHAYRLSLGRQLIDVALIQYEVELRVETESPGDVRAYTYRSPETTFVESVEFTLRVGDIAYAVGLHRDVSRKLVTATRFVPKRES